MTIRQAFLAAMLFLPVIAHAGTTDDRAALVGTWRYEGHVADVGQIKVEVTFRENGTYSGFIDTNGQRHWNYAGKWVLSGGWLHYRYTESDLAKVAPGAEDRDKVLRITSTELLIKIHTGAERSELMFARSPKPARSNYAFQPTPLPCGQWFPRPLRGLGAAERGR